MNFIGIGDGNAVRLAVKELIIEFYFFNSVPYEGNAKCFVEMFWKILVLILNRNKTDFF